MEVLKRRPRVCAAAVLALVLVAPIPACAAPAARTAPAGANAPAGAPDPMRVIAIAQDERRWDDGVLKGALAHGDARVRARAVRAVGLLQDSTTVPDLRPLLHDANDDVRAETAFALGQIGHRSAREALEAATTDANATVARLAVEALGKLGDQAATPRVMSVLGHVSAEMRAAAAVALWRLADSTALDALVARHDDGDPEVRWRVLYALEKLNAPDRIGLVSALHLSDASAQVRAQAVRTIGRQRATRGTAYLMQALVDVEPAVVVNAARALQQVADSVCTPCLPALTRALNHPHPYVRVTVAGALADRFAWVPADSGAKTDAFKILHARLHDTDAATRGAAARALVAQQGVAALDSITPLLDDPSAYTRTAVLRALGLLPAARVAGQVRERLDAGRPLLDRMAAAEVLGTLKVRDAVPALRAGLADSSVLYAAAAASALGDLADTASVMALANAYALRTSDADPDARQSIRDALRALAGATYADSVERAHPERAPRREYPADFASAPAVRGAVIHTTAGDIEWTFETDEAPQTVRNFVTLAERGYFNGTRFHRVVPNFVIQDGDPTGTGSGGPGYTIRCEYNRLPYDAGRVGMALSGKDTGGSQWFITHAPQPHLNGRYTIFARVTNGMDVVHRIVQGDSIVSVDIRK